MLLKSVPDASSVPEAEYVCAGVTFTFRSAIFGLRMCAPFFCRLISPDRTYDPGGGIDSLTES